ncbi:MAG: roadblock/LC7 domain-containing protein [Planctomycetes bacterium]|nr:roadblock/LC7 domain-containing protein [Planctomycetota bacterium]
MKEVLLTLNLEVGVKGSMVMTRDGVLVHSEMGPPLNGDLVSAVASSTVKDINSALKAAGSDEFTRFIFNSSFGKMIFQDTGDAYLVVVLDKSINLDFTLLSITSAARKIKMLTA